jgi:cyclopropane-fatty-acyl-phospholipid synthase
MMKRTQRVIHDLLSSAGIQVNGPDPWDIQIHEPKLYSRILHQGSIGLGESYMEGWWDVQQLDEFFYRLISVNLPEKALKIGIGILLLHKVNFIQAVLINKQTKKRALKVGQIHYDVGNFLYQRMLDKGLNYTCGYWKEATNLDAAQEAKLKLVCEKIHLKPGQKVLDIGCGWGAFAEYAAKNYGAQVIGVTISKEQLEFGQKRCAGLPVELRFQDYRDITDKVDHIVSLGMVEHVGYKNYRDYMRVAHRCLKPEGLFLLHTIGNATSTVKGDPWMEKYIFPEGMIPSIKQLSTAAEGLFVIEDIHNFGAFYDKTLMAWYANVEKHWQELKEHYDERFHRMWSYYLLCCAGGFRARDLQLYQLVLSPKGVPGGYISVR